MRKIQKMKNTFKYILIIGVLFCTFSCGEHHRLKLTMSDFLESVIHFPDSLYIVYDGRVTQESFDKLKGSVRYNLIMYVDSVSCTSCRISSLNNMLRLYDQSEDDKRFSVMTIFSPSKEEVQYLEKSLMRLYYPYPIYIDKTHQFSQVNQLPSDMRLHNFLINQDGNVLFIGNPLENDQLITIFLSTLSNNN